MWFKAVSLLHDGSWSRNVARERWIAPITGWQGVSKGVRKPKNTASRVFIYSTLKAELECPSWSYLTKRHSLHQSQAKSIQRDSIYHWVLLLKKFCYTSFSIRWKAFVARPSCRCSRNPFQLEREGKVSSPHPYVIACSHPCWSTHRAMLSSGPWLSDPV